jgi:hypothetical protein
MDNFDGPDAKSKLGYTYILKNKMEMSNPQGISESRSKIMNSQKRKKIDPRNPNAVLQTDNPKRPIYKLRLHNIDTQ